MLGKAIEIWKATPSWIKWPLLALSAPSLIVTAAFVLIYGIPWIDGRISARVTSFEDKLHTQASLHQEQLNSVIRLQTLQYETLNQRFDRVERQNTLMLKTLLRDRH